ncbi:MAG: delta-aminolevulinic acid dehydratase [Ignavibacteriales bacterium]|nr:delta-aminolevulinic acid dehydratase [Ignavibacteriales bacterium]
MKSLNEAFEKLQKYIEQEKYKGWDPYDALSSPLFKLPFFNSNKFIRFGAQQFVKRSPFNLRQLLRIPKGYNPVTLGLMLQGYCYLMNNEQLKIKNLELESKINFLVNELERLQSKVYSGACWGYDFDWEARYAKIAAYQPTVVATGIITNALYICYSITGNEKAKELLVSAAKFVLNDLNRTYILQPTTDHPLPTAPFSFSYSPFDKQCVFNASMKGSRLLSQVYSITKEESLINEAKNAVEFVIKEQNPDGSWYYSKAVSGKWVDNYHTGYVLDCLDEYQNNSNDKKYNEYIKNGFNYYLKNFFESDGAPKFYNNKKYPIDCTAAAQSILTLTRFGNEEIADKVAEYMINNMQNDHGYFYFRGYDSKTEKTSFMRWSNAWMFTALAKLVSGKHQL